MDNGTYTARFQTNLGSFGAGIVTVVGDKITGGDSSYRYSGTYKERGETIHARIAVNHYAGERNSVFGPLSSFTLDLQGVMRGGAGRLEGSVVEMPQARIGILLNLVEQMAAE